MSHKDPQTIEQHVIDTIRSIKYGAVSVSIHDSKVVQVEKTEKTRFDLPRTAN